MTLKGRDGLLRGDLQRRGRRRQLRLGVRPAGAGQGGQGVRGQPAADAGRRMDAEPGADQSGFLFSLKPIGLRFHLKIVP